MPPNIPTPPAVGHAITVRVREVYGVTRAYPVCRNAEAAASIAGTKTLTRTTLRLLAAWGFSIVDPHGRPVDPMEISP